MKLPTLYKLAKTGATQVLNMEIIGDTYTREWGQKDGKMQTKATTAKPKNVGRSNETTAEEQAIIEAKAVWAKKMKANYSESEEAPVLVELPMKVNSYDKHKAKITFPCYISPKLNGVNCEYRKNAEGTLELLSRGGEQYQVPIHQVPAIHAAMTAMGTTRINGEMYIHGEHLQNIMAAVKKPNPQTKDLVFHIFDVPLIDENYTYRGELLYKVTNSNYVKVIPVSVAQSEEDIESAFKEVTSLGYEGLMVRNASGKYVYNTRSYDVLKYKVAQDAEFEVKSFDIDKNGHAVFHCYKDFNHVGDNCTFKVKLKGTNEERLAMAANAKDYIGKWLKVEFEMLSQDDIPLKPVGIHFRKVDSNGEATE